MYYNSNAAIMVTGITRGQLQYWDKKGVVKPSMGASGRGSQRLYSFRDLVQLKAAKSLRDQGLGLQRLRKALANLRKLFPDIEKPLAEMTFLTDGDTVFVMDRDPKVLVDVLRKQFVFSVPFGRIVEELKGKVKVLSRPKKQVVKVRGTDYEVVLIPDIEDGGYSVRCPALPANSQGYTEQEAIDNIIDAIEACLDAEEEIRREQSIKAAG
ncbi:MAG: MerR family transcriptional regulator [Desulfobacterales bacterium]|nr:MerR family transcriptional regulator [Desulfobacterales bacterium]